MNGSTINSSEISWKNVKHIVIPAPWDYFFHCHASLLWFCFTDIDSGKKIPESLMNWFASNIPTPPFPLLISTFVFLCVILLYLACWDVNKLICTWIVYKCCSWEGEKRVLWCLWTQGPGRRSLRDGMCQGKVPVRWPVSPLWPHLWHLCGCRAQQLYHLWNWWGVKTVKCN